MERTTDIEEKQIFDRLSRIGILGNVLLAAFKLLAGIFGVSLDDLANYESKENLGLGIPPRGKHLFGLVTVGDKGQIVIPVQARRVFRINPGDQLMVLGDEDRGIALMDAKFFMQVAEVMQNGGK